MFFACLSGAMNESITYGAAFLQQFPIEKVKYLSSISTKESEHTYSHVQVRNVTYRLALNNHKYYLGTVGLRYITSEGLQNDRSFNFKFCIAYLRIM